MLSLNIKEFIYGECFFFVGCYCFLCFYVLHQSHLCDIACDNPAMFTQPLILWILIQRTPFTTRQVDLTTGVAVVWAKSFVVCSTCLSYSSGKAPHMHTML